MDSLIEGIENIQDYHDIFGGPPLSFGPNQHHSYNHSFLAVVRNGRSVTAIERLMSY